MMGIDGVPLDLITVPLGPTELGGQDMTGQPGLERVALMPVPGGGPPIEGLVGSMGSAPFRGGQLTLDYAGGRAWFEPSGD